MSCLGGLESADAGGGGGGGGKDGIDGLSWGLFSITFGRLGWGWAGWHSVVVSGQMMMVEEEEEEVGERREGWKYSDVLDYCRIHSVL